MSEEQLCQCGTPWLEPNGECSRCHRKVAPERALLLKSSSNTSTTISSEPQSAEYHYPDFKNAAFGKKVETLEQQKEVGIAAAQRTVKYSSLFENIGKWMQFLNLIGALILFVAGFYISGPSWVKFVYWAAILIIWAFAYIQTALIRGLASYFQMKASDHLIRYWPNKDQISK